MNSLQCNPRTRRCRICWYGPECGPFYGIERISIDEERPCPCECHTTNDMQRYYGVTDIATQSAAESLMKFWYMKHLGLSGLCPLRIDLSQYEYDLMHAIHGPFPESPQLTLFGHPVYVTGC